MDPRLIKLIVSACIAIGIASVAAYNVLTRGTVADAMVAAPPPATVAKPLLTPQQETAARLQSIVDEYANLDLHKLPVERALDVTGRKVVVIDLDTHALHHTQTYLDDTIRAESEKDVGLVVYKQSLAKNPRNSRSLTVFFYAVAHPEHKVVAAEKTTATVFVTQAEIEAFAKRIARPHT